MFNPLTKYLGQVVGSGQCVALVQEVCGTPLTHLWKRGQEVRGYSLDPGTAIATFDEDGTYGNHTDGRSHAAIYIGQTSQAILVIDQWVGQVCHHRPIVFDASRKDCNNGNKFFVIELQ